MLSYFGHIARRKGNNLEKIIMQCMIWRKEQERTTSVPMDWPNKINYRTSSPWLLRSCWRSSSMASYLRGHELSCQPWQERTNLATNQVHLLLLPFVGCCCCCFVLFCFVCLFVCFLFPTSSWFTLPFSFCMYSILDWVLSMNHEQQQWPRQQSTRNYFNTFSPTTFQR